MLDQKSSFFLISEPDARSEAETPQSAAVTPSLSSLSYALRHPETWPDAFFWDYEDCKSCAIGLTCQLWSVSAPQEADVDVRLYLVSQCFRMPIEAARRVFLEVVPPWSWRRPFNRHHVAPEHVAMAIDRYVASAHF
jgi:hypothetical protein